jgi:staphylococcal nuclease domain-containing protein 1
MSSFRSFHISSSANKPLEQAPKAGDFVSARFAEDNEWYRARIRRNDRENKTAEVVYIDYGQKLRAQALDAVLSFLQFPTAPEYLREAVNIISESTADRQLVANVDYIDPREGTLHVTLFDPKQSDSLKESVNADIISEGFAMVPKKLKAWERGAGDILADLQAREAEAKSNRLGQWEYGDLTED